MNCKDVNECLVTGAFDRDLIRVVQLLEIADPGLACLSPLARAALRLHLDGYIRHEEAKQALATTFLVASSFPAQELLSGDSVTTGEIERVEHVINVEVKSRAGSQSIPLCFKSMGSIEHASAGDAAITLDQIDLALGAGDNLTEADIFDAFEREFKREYPTCYPCDTDFIGMITYHMNSVDDQQVSGPCLTDCAHQIEFADLGILKEEPKGREFCWLHQLTQEQANALGLARTEGKHPDPAMPDWLADDLTFSKLWIDPDDLLESYSQGTLNSYEVDSLLLCVGAGPEWFPGDLNGQVNEIDVELDQISEFPETQLPIRVFSLSKGSFCDDPELAPVLRLISRLVRACHSDKSRF